MPLLDLFLTVMWFVLFCAWIWLVVWVIADIFRSQDLSGWAKALWTLLVVIVPWLGVFAYLVARGASMAERGRQWAFGEDRP
jgi:Phospholipase_D-nuclease N-terminal